MTEQTCEKVHKGTFLVYFVVFFFSGLFSINSQMQTSKAPTINRLMAGRRSSYDINLARISVLLYTFCTPLRGCTLNQESLEREFINRTVFTDGTSKD